MRAQPGIFALGTPEHCFLELDLVAPGGAAALLTALAGASGPLTTGGGVNVVVGLRPELWAELSGGDVPAGACGWADDLVGPDGFTMPATQHDAWVWVAGGTRTAVFDNCLVLLAAVNAVAVVATDTIGWLYRHDRDLTGFVDGTENPTLLEAPAVAVVPDSAPGAGCSVVLHQLWRHQTRSWEALGLAGQERAMGRTKVDSVELAAAEMPPDSHVSRTVVERDGEELDIFRRNVAWGGPTEHGTVFVGFSHDQWRMQEMLRRMAGIGDGIRCALTRHTTPLTGAFYVVPPVEALARFAG